MQKVRWLILEGAEKNSREHIRVLFSGSRAERYDINGRVFGGNGREVSRGELPRRLFFLLVRYNLFSCDLMFFQHRPGCDYRPEKQDFIIPLWIGADVVLPVSTRSKSAKEELRIIRRNKLSYSVTSEQALIENFFDSIWKPTVQKRYPEKDADSERENWGKHHVELLLVKELGQDIAGVLIRYD